jgi:hypothetical protein
VAELFGCQLISVELRRRKLHIPSVNPRGPRPNAWTPSETALLGTASDKAVAKRLGRTVVAVAIHRKCLGIRNPHNEFVPWTPEETALLGKMRDEEVARRTGRPLGSVSVKRLTLRLPQPDPKVRRWTPQEEEILGKVSDQDAARHLGRSVTAVKLHRKILKITSVSASQRQ